MTATAQRASAPPPPTPTPIRWRRGRRTAAVVSVLTAVGVLAAPALTPSSSSADTLAFPYVHDFSSSDGGTLSGDARIVDDRLRLTDDVQKQAGAWSTNDTFPSDLGLEVEFDYAMYTTSTDEGADGLLLFLADGAAPQGVGAYGAALGYACRSSATQGDVYPCDLPGVPGGVVAVALDRYGNFSKALNESGPGPRPDSVVVRGSGDDVTGYRYVEGVSAPGGTRTAGRGTRKVRVTLQPDGPGNLAISVRMEVNGVMKTVLDRVPLAGDGQAPLPATLRLGFSAATGSHVDVHEIDALRVWQPADLAVSQDMPASAVAGSDLSYEVHARNVGVNDSDPSPLRVDVPDGLQDVSWTCAPEAGSGCATASGTGDVVTGLDLPRGGSAVVTVTGRVAPDATGPLESTATIAPASPLADSDETNNTSVVSAAVVQPPPATNAQVETDKSVTPSVGVAPGDALEYVVTARNRGPATAADVGAVDRLPDAVRFTGSDDGCTADGQLVTCRSGRSLGVGESVDFRIRAVLDPDYRGDGSDVVNVATATSPTDQDGGDPSPEVSIGVVVPGGGDDDGGGGGGDDGGGDGGGGDDGRPSPTTWPSATPTPTSAPTSAGASGVGGDGAGGGPASGGRPGSLAWTGAEGLGLLGATGGAAVLLGGAVWWVRRRRAAIERGAGSSE